MKRSRSGPCTPVHVLQGQQGRLGGVYEEGEDAQEPACQVGDSGASPPPSAVRWDDSGGGGGGGGGGVGRGAAAQAGGSLPTALTACHGEITATCLSVRDADG